MAKADVFSPTNLNVLYVLSMHMPTISEDAENESLDDWWDKEPTVMWFFENYWQMYIINENNHFVIWNLHKKIVWDLVVIETWLGHHCIHTYHIVMCYNTEHSYTCRALQNDILQRLIISLKEETLLYRRELKFSYR